MHAAEGVLPRVFDDDVNSRLRRCFAAFFFDGGQGEHLKQDARTELEAMDEGFTVAPVDILEELIEKGIELCFLFIGERVEEFVVELKVRFPETFAFGEIFLGLLGWV